MDAEIKELSGKTAVVTGGGSGIGRALAAELVAHGMRVVVADIDGERLAEAERDLGVVGVRCDVGDLSSVEALSDTVRRDVGPVDLLCNNAGIGNLRHVVETTAHEWERVLAVNLWGVVHGLLAFLPDMVGRGTGHVVNTASLAGLYAFPGIGPYTASKYAVVGISETLRLELEGTGVGVSVLCPGIVRTNIFTQSAFLASNLGGPSRSPELRDRQRAVAAHAAEHGMDPRRVASEVVAAILRNDFWILTHYGEMSPLEKRCHELLELARGGRGSEHLQE
jgi:NAD(P)-dependent dehydrogenase (short-subunit alcohol dehydrogenase family)